MFDTLRIRNSLHSPCGLGNGWGCGGEERLRDQMWAEVRSLEAMIPQLDIKIKEYKNGELQKQYVAIEQKQQTLRNRKNRLNAEIQQARLKRDAWVANPSNQAQLEGLGFIKGLWDRNFTCRDAEESQAEAAKAMIPLKDQIGRKEQEIKGWEAKHSSESMKLMEKTTQALETEVNNLADQLATIEKEIANYQANFKAQKEAEAVAKIVGQDKETKAQQKKDNTILIAGVVAVGVIMLALMMKTTNKPKSVSA